ncbi:Gfo/Idh/MocA family oxidoreductase, partial [Salmonella enterica]|uniref:Gfo/Idh/MocA family oxidoreductase n=1 Tax=Salmonella enterica TaxID=28901 RepID=UPI003F1DAD07
SNLPYSCDQVLDHYRNASHYALESELLNEGVQVCVDKPLAEKQPQAERLVALAAQKKYTQMLGFKRPFAPRYSQQN